jgi:hypothetical protein
VKVTAVLILLAIAAPALADPPPVAVAAPEETVTVLRADWTTIMAEAEVAQEQRQLLLQCQEDVATLAKQSEEPEDRWRALKWSGITAAILTAFVAGVWLGH